MSSVSRVRKVTPANERDIDSATLATQATTLRNLKWICAWLATSTILVSATFGVLTHNLMQRMEENERKADGRLTQNESVMMIHEPNQTDTHFELTEIWTHLAVLEADLDAYKTSTQEGYNRLRTVEASLETERQTIRNLSATIKAFTVSHVEYENNKNFINGTRDIWANTETDGAIIEEHILTQLETNMTEDRIDLLHHDARILQLEALLTAQNATLHVQDSKIQRLEMNITDDQTRILLQGKRLLEIETSLNVQGATIQAHDSKINELESQGKVVNDTLSNNTARLAQLETDMGEANDNMRQLQTDFIAQNTSIQEATERLAQLEMDVTEDQANIMIQESRLLQAEAKLVAQNASLQTYASKLDELEAQAIANRYMLSNHTDSLIELETNLIETDASVKCASTTNEAQTVQIVQLMFGFNNEYGCDTDFRPYGLSCYKFSSNKLDWSTAEYECRNLGGYLVEITDACENDFVSMIAKGVSETFWLGGTDEDQEGEWRWFHSQTEISDSTFSNWGPGRPDNSGGGEHYLSLRLHGHLTADGTAYWEDDHYVISLPYICEKDRRN